MKNFFITLFLGWAGVHKFMQKKIGMGFVYLFTMGLFGIGWFIDIIISFTRIFACQHQKQQNVNALQSTPVFYNTTNPLSVSTPSVPATLPQNIPNEENKVDAPNWYISLSFGKSSSVNYDKAVALAKSAPQYHEQVDNGNILHQAIYSSKPKEYLAFIMLYELVHTWKSSFVMINGKLVDRKIVGNLNYCYGDRCRSGSKKFCYGASYMTENPFGCHRLQISAANNPWWSFYRYLSNKWVLDKAALKDRIDSHAGIYCICPCFDYENIITVLDSLPATLSNQQMKELSNDNFGLKMNL